MGTPDEDDFMSQLIQQSQLQGNSIQVAVEAVAEKIAPWVLGDQRRLFQNLYRLDVDEERVRYILEQKKGDLKEKTLKIAELIVKREIAKFESRKKYGQ